MQINNNLITLTDNDVRFCYEFAETALQMKSQSSKQFGSEEYRSRNDFIADQIEGKLAEIAMRNFLSVCGLEIELDFNHYESKLELDSGDISAIIEGGKRFEVGVRVDAKGSTKASKWLLVEEHKYNSNYYIFIRFLDLPRKSEARKNPEALLNREYHGEAVGWASAEDFKCPITQLFWFEYEKGSSPLHPRCLPYERPASFEILKKWLDNREKEYMHVKLDARINYGLPVNWLRRDWNALISRIRASVKL